MDVGKKWNIVSVLYEKETTELPYRNQPSIVNG